MPAGQAHTTWFPELKLLLKNKWQTDLTIKDHLKLLTDLNDKLTQIRTEGNMQPAMMWCPKCKERHRSKFTEISITAMYFALKRFEICTENEFNELRKKWKLYSANNNLDIYGKTMDTTDIEHSTKA